LRSRCAQLVYSRSGKVIHVEGDQRSPINEGTLCHIGVGMTKRRIGILTGGGDVPGLNAVIKTVTYRGSENDVEVIGLRRGWEALTHLNIEDPVSRSQYIVHLNRENTRTIDRRGGTMLYSSRTNPSKMQRLPPHLFDKDSSVSVSTNGGGATETWDVTGRVLANLSALGIEHLIAIGGDDTLSYAAKLNTLGVKIIAIPKTMDNDVHNTEYCIGFSTAITRASDAIQRQRTSVSSLQRIGIFRVFGRDAGFTALYTAYASSIRCVIPEYKVNLDKLVRLLIEDKRSNPSSYAMVVLSEGAEWEGYKVQEYGEPDAYGHRKRANVAESLAEEIRRYIGEETIVSDLTYDLRSGDPDFIDKLVAITFGNVAYDAIVEGKTGLMSALVEGRYDLVPIPDAQLGPRGLDVATTYDTERYRPIYANKRGLPIFLNRAS
jgi:ATP-dependent phosphofructokinase / diphosphate-dependent phosphofructokinase